MTGGRVGTLFVPTKCPAMAGHYEFELNVISATNLVVIGGHKNHAHPPTPALTNV